MRERLVGLPETPRNRTRRRREWMEAEAVSPKVRATRVAEREAKRQATVERSVDDGRVGLVRVPCM